MYKSTIATTLILEAIDYYSKLGYKLIDVPQCVDFEVSQHTKPEGVPELFHRDMKVYVASAEQSFIQLHKDNLISEGKYMALTPCYRHEPFLDNTHYSIFLKLELIDINSTDSFSVACDSLGFFKPKVDKETYILSTEEGIKTCDIICDNTEIGSYGVRYMMNGTPYVYGTGIAEPRFSSLVNCENKKVFRTKTENNAFLYYEKNKNNKIIRSLDDAWDDL